jgi:hypothetical protein
MTSHELAPLCLLACVLLLVVGAMPAGLAVLMVKAAVLGLLLVACLIGFADLLGRLLAGRLTDGEDDHAS